MEPVSSVTSFLEDSSKPTSHTEWGRGWLVALAILIIKLFTTMDYPPKEAV